MTVKCIANGKQEVLFFYDTYKDAIKTAKYLSKADRFVSPNAPVDNKMVAIDYVEVFGNDNELVARFRKGTWED